MRLSSMTYSGIQCGVWLGVPDSFVPTGHSIQLWPVALYSSSPLKECLYPKQLMQWLDWGFHSWLQLFCLTFFFLPCLGMLSPDLKRLWEMEGDHMSIMLSIQHLVQYIQCTTSNSSNGRLNPCSQCALSFEGSGWCEHGEFCRPRSTQLLLTTKLLGSRLMVTQAWLHLCVLSWCPNGHQGQEGHIHPQSQPLSNFLYWNFCSTDVLSLLPTHSYPTHSSQLWGRMCCSPGWAELFV